MNHSSNLFLQSEKRIINFLSEKMPSQTRVRVVTGATPYFLHILGQTLGKKVKVNDGKVRDLAEVIEDCSNLPQTFILSGWTKDLYVAKLRTIDDLRKFCDDAELDNETYLNLHGAFVDCPLELTYGFSNANKLVIYRIKVLNVDKEDYLCQKKKPTLVAKPKQDKSIEVNMEQYETEVLGVKSNPQSRKFSKKKKSTTVTNVKV